MKCKILVAVVLVAIGIIILYGCGQSEPKFTPDDVAEKLSLEDVLDAYEERDYDRARRDLAYHLVDEIELDEILNWYDVSRYDIAWKKMSDDRSIIWEYLNEYPEIALEFAREWNS